MITNIDRNLMTQRILDLTLEIICLLIGEDHMVVKIPYGRVGDSSRCYVSEGYRKSQTSNVEPPPRSLIQERNNEQKILELTHRIICMLTGEVPIRCEDVTVYLSMEEWEYVERHKDLYKDVMMEDHQLITALGKSVSGEFQAPVSALDLVTKSRTEDKPDLETNKTTEGQTATHTQRGSLAFGKSQVTERDIYTHTENPPPDIKEEPASCDEGNLTDRDVYKPTEHTQNDYNTIYLKEQSDSYEEGDVPDGDVYKPTEHTPGYVEGCLELNTNPLEINPSESFLESRKPDNRTYKAGVSPVIVINTELAPDSAASSEMGKVLNFDSDFVTNETNCREDDLVSSDGGENSHESERLKHRNGHTEEQPLPCSECEEQFKDHVALNTHQKVHMAGKVFKCTECEKGFVHSSDLVRHKMIHTGDKPFSCTECGKRFSSNFKLIIHQRTHTGEKPFKCAECGRCFSQGSHLTAHKMIHTGNKPFICTECGKCFTQASCLARHRRTHTGEKPYKCPDCEKCYTQASSLARHKITHTGEKPYKCFDCGKSFTLSTHLASHKWVHSAGKSESCAEHGKSFSLKSHTDESLKTHT